MMTFLKVSSEVHFKTIETLANTIWREHYIPIIGKAQVEYMLDKFQSYEAIKQQTFKDNQYFILKDKADDIGYISIKKDRGDLFLSKLYILKSKRGKGFAKEAMDFIENKAKTLKCTTISLTVNKNNINTIQVYNKLGFKNQGAIVIDIGNGFVMDDYKMQKVID